MPDSVREERQSKLLPSLRRDQHHARRVRAGTDRFTVAKDNGHWALVVGTHRYEADEPEIERILTEAEFVSAVAPTRCGSMPASRERFGLTNPRVRVTLREARNNVAMTFAVGGLVATNRLRTSRSTAQGSWSPQQLRGRVRAPRERASRPHAVALSSRHGSRDSRWTGARRSPRLRADAGHLATDDAFRRARRRTRMESLLHDLRDMRATRFLVDEADAAAMQRAGLRPRS